MRQRRMSLPTRVTRGSRLGGPLRGADGLGVGAHRAELDDREAAAALADAHLAVEHRARRVELDGERDDQHDRRQDDRGERGDDDVGDAAGRRVLQAAVQRERLDEPGGVDLLDRHATEGALVEVAELEHGRRAVDVEQVIEQRQPVAAGGQDDRVDVVAADDVGELVELAQHRHDRVRVIADEADELDAVGARAWRSCAMSLAASSPAPRPSTRSGRSVVCVRCWRTSQPATARKPIREAATSRRGSAPVSSRAAAATTRAVTSVAAWAWRTRRTASARWYSPRSRSRAVPTKQRDRGRGDRREEAGRRGTERDSPGKQHHRGQHELWAPLPSECERARRQRHRVGDGAGVRCAWGNCHWGVRCSWGGESTLHRPGWAVHVPQKRGSAGTARAYAGFCRLQPPPRRSPKWWPDPPIRHNSSGEREPDVLRAARHRRRRARAAIPARSRACSGRRAGASARSSRAARRRRVPRRRLRRTVTAATVAGTRHSTRPSGWHATRAGRCGRPRPGARARRGRSAVPTSGSSSAVRAKRAKAASSARRPPSARASRSRPSASASARVAASASRRRTKPGWPRFELLDQPPRAVLVEIAAAPVGLLRAVPPERHPVDLAIDVGWGDDALHPHGRRLGQPLGQAPARLPDLDRVEQLVGDVTRNCSTPVVLSGATSAGA